MGRVLGSTLAAALMAIALGSATAETPRWETAPPAPTLPPADQSGLVAVNGIKIWYASFGSGSPVILLHGGLANSNYWGGVVPTLAKSYRVIVMDSRGHGRSTRDTRPFAYAMMADDVLGLMDELKIPKAAIVGWSDGAIIGLDIAMRHPERLDGVFAFGANADPSGVIENFGAPTFVAYGKRAAGEYDAISPTPGHFDEFNRDISRMWSVEPHFTAVDLGSIRVPVWIADGDHEEAIKRSHTLWIADHIPKAGLLIEPEVSHFALIQAPAEFAADVERFLARLAAK